VKTHWPHGHLHRGLAGSARRGVDQPHVRPMDFTGRPMKGMIFVEPAGLHDDGLRHWVSSAACYARSLPPKGHR
jgi:hypothetical protein